MMSTEEVEILRRHVATGPFVPRRTYRTVADYQHIYGSALLGLPDEETPVVMRGALHARIRKRGPKRYYVTAVLQRFIRMRRVTCLEHAEWALWVSNVLWPLAKRKGEKARPLLYGQRFSFNDIAYMVRPGVVLIDGHRHEIEPPIRTRQLQPLLSMLRRVDMLARA